MFSLLKRGDEKVCESEVLGKNFCRRSLWEGKLHDSKVMFTFCFFDDTVRILCPNFLNPNIEIRNPKTISKSQMFLF